MASTRDIRRRIKSVKNTAQITKAMQMVASSKMRRAQERMAASKPYAQKMLEVISHLARATPEYRHSFMAVERSRKRVGYIVVSSDRGLCGGLNSNLFRRLIAEIKEQRALGVDPAFCTIGTKALGFFKRFGGSVLAQATHLGDKPHVEELIGTVRVMLDAFEEKKIDAIYIASNEFVNTMTQKPKLLQLLPIKCDELTPELAGHWDYIYEPDAKEVLDDLLVRYVESLVFQGLVENNACEQAARMVAMKSASDNAGKLISELQLIYNKARQAAITQEISEIVGGAAAV